MLMPKGKLDFYRDIIDTESLHEINHLLVIAISDHDDSTLKSTVQEVVKHDFPKLKRGK